MIDLNNSYGGYLSEKKQQQPNKIETCLLYQRQSESVSHSLKVLFWEIVETEFIAEFEEYSLTLS